MTEKSPSPVKKSVSTIARPWCVRNIVAIAEELATDMMLLVWFTLCLALYTVARVYTYH